MAAELAGRNAFLGIAHQRDGGEPFGQRQVRIVEQSAGRGTELEFAGSALKQTPWAASLVLGLDLPAPAVIASQTANALRPTRPDQVIQCILFCREPPC